MTTLENGRPRAKPTNPVKDISSKKAGAFTLTELLVVVVTIGLLVAAIVPAYSAAKAKSDRLWCTNFQKQMGTAFRVFASDNGDMYPLQTKTNAYIVPTGATAAQVNSTAAEPWQIMQCMWNELQSPRVLLCPSDRERARLIRVEDFNGFAGKTGSVTTASLAHPANQNNAVSYAFAVAADESRPLGVLIVDRNVNNVGVAGAGVVSNVALTRSRVVLNATVGPTQAVWVKGTPIHDLQGNLTYADGSVMQATSEVLRQSLENAATAYSTITNHSLLVFP